ncbi:MAG TPA: hypothetical protein VHG08_16950 [Longimicrobium sp.]|nr:hypothetical protein [Longimicrobium sp.]
MAVNIDSRVPLEVLIDFQSVHRAAFRLFARTAGGEWEFVKDGTGDQRTILPPLPSGSALLYEFIYFAESRPFRAAVALRQNGRLLPDGVIPVTAAGDVRFIQGEVDLV